MVSLSTSIGREMAKWLISFTRTDLSREAAEGAIEIAKCRNIKLKVASKVDAADQNTGNKHLPTIRSPADRILGEIGHDEKQRLWAVLARYLFLSTGVNHSVMVMIESMACGTPVMAYRAGQCRKY